MPRITKEDVLKLAKLSSLRLSEEEIEQFQFDISTILKYVEQLHAIDLDKYTPTSQVTGLVNVMRPDEEVDYGISKKELLKNVPQVHEDQIKVKRVL